MSLDEIYTQIVNLKPAFVIDNSEKTRGYYKAETEKALQRIDETLEKIKIRLSEPSLDLEAMEIYLSLLSSEADYTTNIIPAVKYRKLTDLLSKQGFSKYSAKYIGDYEIDVVWFEETISFLVQTRHNYYNLANANIKIKNHIEKISPEKFTYELRHDNLEEADEISIPSRYTVDIWKSPTEISELIKDATRGYYEELLSERKEPNLDALFDETVSKEIRKQNAIKMLENLNIPTPSLTEIQDKKFLAKVRNLVNKRLEESHNNLMKTAEKDVEKNVNIMYIERDIHTGLSVYRKELRLWSNATEPITPESLDKIIENMKTMEPLFNSLNNSL